MNLNEALRQLATDGNLDVDELIAYAAEDTHGGRDTGHFGGGAVHAVEGRVIYALVRALRPLTCLELGVADGGSTAHILAALEANGEGQLISYDIDPAAGEKVPQALRGRWTLIQQDVLTVDFPEAVFIFEDTAHTLDFSIKLFRNLAALNPRIILTHDYYTHLVYGNFAVEQAFKTVFGDAGKGLLLDNAFTGLGYWWNGDWQIEQVMDADSESVDEPTGEPDLDDDVIEVKEVKPKAKPRRKAAKRG